VVKKGEILTPREAAEAIGVDRETIYRMIRDGKLPAMRVGTRSLRIERAAVETLLRPVEKAR
jgi:excisionase family DNA binding protein